MKQGKRSHEVSLDVRLSVVKPLHAKWAVKFYDYIRSKPAIVINGWRKSGIVEKLKENVELDPFSM